MNEEARDVKLNFWQILFSPFISLKNMVNSKPDIENDIELNINSNDKQEAALAKSLEKVDSEVQNYGNEQLISEKAEKKSHREIVEELKVAPLNKVPKLKDSKNIINKNKEVEETGVSEEQINKTPKAQTKKAQKDQDLEIGEK